MTERNIEFLVDPNGRAPRNLVDAIRRVQNASSGFIQSWISGDLNDARETSQDAFSELDYIQGELLRQRDAVKNSSATQSPSAFLVALSTPVGKITHNVTPSDRTLFIALAAGVGALPLGLPSTPLTCEQALTKLKHRDTAVGNFRVQQPNSHILYIFTNAGMGQNASISEIDVLEFCKACKSAASHV
jgi:hypothetical protein